MQPHPKSLALGALAGALVIAVVANLGLLISPTVAQPAPNDQRITNLERELHEMNDSTQRAQVLAVTFQLDSAGFHGLSESLNAGTVPSNAVGLVRRSRITAQATSWPAELRETANRMIQEMSALEAAVRDEDAARAAGPGDEVHDLEHDLSDMVYSLYGGGTPPASSDDDQ